MMSCCYLLIVVSLVIANNFGTGNGDKSLIAIDHVVDVGTGLNLDLRSFKKYLEPRRIIFHPKHKFLELTINGTCYKDVYVHLHRNDHSHVCSALQKGDYHHQFCGSFKVRANETGRHILDICQHNTKVYHPRIIGSSHSIEVKYQSATGKYCNDDKTPLFCSTAVKSGECKSAEPKTREYAQKNCAKSCGLCDHVFQCGENDDPLPVCMIRKNKGQCKEESTKKRMQDNCAAVCGYCNDAEHKADDFIIEDGLVPEKMSFNYARRDVFHANEKQLVRVEFSDFSAFYMGDKKSLSKYVQLHHNQLAEPCQNTGNKESVVKNFCDVNNHDINKLEDVSGLILQAGSSGVAVLDICIDRGVGYSDQTPRTTYGAFVTFIDATEALCQDKEDVDCSEMKNLCSYRDKETVDYMKQSCSRTCGYCKKENCGEDDAPVGTCLSKEKAGDCTSNDSAKRDFMRRSCKKMCGFCDVVCMNTKEYDQKCVAEKKRICTAKHMYPFAHTHCRKTCGFCHREPTM